ncbi:related to Fruiting body protein SC7 precursor [Moesziomyces antarcticus]|uniref:Related to Fruiting body protein SC7 n=1 Tax=Pseudozyma antarctica TaxID=84753 RepID=A0A5C3G0E3_PSEA2|nr:related to Fruiting body protein SC7 precursor [Moesziomyces antarcticus]
MSQMARVMRLALVAMLFVVVLTSSQVSADRVAHQPRNAHPGLRKAMFGRRSTMMPDPSDPDCPEGEENGPAHLQEVAQRLADTSEKDGGKEETYDAVVPGPQGETHVDVRARSERPEQEGTSNANGGSLPSSSRARPQEVEGKETVVHASHSRHTSDTTKSVSTSEDDGDGKVKKHKTETKTHDSSSSSSYKSFTNVFHYVISGDMQHSGNGAPFADGHIEWSTRLWMPLLWPSKRRLAVRFCVLPGPTSATVASHGKASSTLPWTETSDSTILGRERRSTRSRRLRSICTTRSVLVTGWCRCSGTPSWPTWAACWADLKAYGHSEDHYCASGENIAMGAGDTCYGNPLQGKNAIMSFLDEDRNWAREAHLADDDGHWTQIVWKDTRFVGCAVSQRKGLAQSYSHSDGATMYVVCEYYPSGNVQGQFEHQVPRVKPLPRLRSQCSANEVHTRR